MVAHFAVDFCSARATTYLWEKKLRHWFFVVIGVEANTATVLIFHETVAPGGPCARLPYCKCSELTEMSTYLAA